jgi:hypothetical protein
MSWTQLTLRLTARSLTNPAIALALVRVAWRFRRRGWAGRFPFLPLPDVTYMRWRMYTAYGDTYAVPHADDVIRYALWATRHP